MQSPSMQESLHSHTPESKFTPSLKVSQLDPPSDGWKERCWIEKHEENETSGYALDSELFREGSD